MDVTNNVYITEKHGYPVIFFIYHCPPSLYLATQVKEEWLETKGSLQLHTPTLNPLRFNSVVDRDQHGHYDPSAAVQLHMQPDAPCSDTCLPWSTFSFSHALLKPDRFPF